MTMELSFDALLERADTAAKAGNWQRALDVLQEAVKIEPDHQGALSGIGTCRLQLGRTQEAVIAFQELLELAPDSPDAHVNLGVAYSLTGNLEEAERACRQALTLDAEHVPSWKNLALIHIQQGRLMEGVQILAALVQSNAKDAEAVLLLARCYEIGGELTDRDLAVNQVRPFSTVIFANV
jgi:Flp pilus assembly protein TadD